MPVTLPVRKSSGILQSGQKILGARIGFHFYLNFLEQGFQLIPCHLERKPHVSFHLMIELFKLC